MPPGMDGHAISENFEGRPSHQREIYWSIAMAWLYLFAAGLLEVGWAVGLKYTDGFTRIVPTTLTVLSMVASVGLLGLSLKSLPLGTAYAIWTGIGTIGTVILGIALFGESASALRLGCIALIVAGIIGLKAVSVE
jgi:quaternary ammonium compound-resistance protein SugE